MLDQMVGDILIEKAAKAAGKSVDAYLEQDAAKRLPPVSDAEIAQFFEENKDRAQGRTLEQLRGQISEFLDRPARAAGARAARRRARGQERRRDGDARPAALRGGDRRARSDPRSRPRRR